MEERNYTVYCHTNQVNGKKYVGITGGSPTKRWNKGSGYHEGSCFRNAIDKYGWDAFTHDILETNLTKEIAELREQHYIATLDTISPNGYNLSSGGNIGTSLSVEARKKISDKAKTRVVSEETRQKLREKMRGRVISEHTKYLMSKAAKGRKVSDSTREKLRQANLGKKASEEARRKMSEAGYKHPVICIELNKEFKSVRDAAKYIGRHECGIHNACSGAQKRCGGYHWRYKE